MEIDKDYLQTILNRKTFVNERDVLVSEIVDIINLERKNTKYKPVTKRVVAIRLNKKFSNDNQKIYSTMSICKDYKNRNGSFSKCFWGILK